MSETRADFETRRDELRAKTEDGDLGWAMSDARGRRLIWRLVEQFCGAFDASFTDQALLTAYAEGKRAPGLRLVAEVQRVAPNDYLRMLAEEMARRAEAKARPPPAE